MNNSSILTANQREAGQPSWVELCRYKRAFRRYSLCEFMHDLYIAEIYRSGAIFLPLIVWVYFHSLCTSPCDIYYLRQGGGYTIKLVCLSLVLSFYVQDYCKSNQSISLKFGVMIRPTSRKNWLTFGGDTIPDTDSGSLFHFPRHCEVGDFRRFITVFHIQLPADCHDIRPNDWRQEKNILGAIKQTSGPECCIYSPA